MKTTVLLRNGNLIGLEPLKVEPLDLLVHEGRVVERGARLQAPRDAEVVDCRGRFILPGFVNAHTEIAGAQALGAPRAFHGDAESPIEQSFALRARLDAALEPETIVTGAFAWALEAVRCGTTTVIDLHQSSACVKGSLALMRDALLTVGLRSILSYAARCSGDAEAIAQGAEENRRFAAESRTDKAAGMIGVDVSPEADAAALAALAALHTDGARGVHGRIGERLADMEAKTSAAALLDAAGLLGPHTVLAHGVHLGDADRELIRQRGAWIVHTPSSDARRGLPGCPFERQDEQVALGTGTGPSDMFAEARSAYERARARGRNVSPEDVIKLIVGGQQLASEILGVELGSTRRDAGADFLVLEYHPRTPIRSDNLADHLLFGMGSRHVDAVMIDGVFVYRDRRYLDVDARRLAPLMRRGAEQLWEAMEPAASPEPR